MALGSGGASASRKAHAAQGTTTWNLVTTVCGAGQQQVGRACWDEPGASGYTVNDGTATSTDTGHNPSTYNGSYTWSLPSSMPADGGSASLSVTANDTSNNSGFVAQICLAGAIPTKEAGDQCAHADAVPPPPSSASGSKTLTLNPGTAADGAQATVTIQFGAGSVIYTYQAGNPAPPQTASTPPAACTARATASACLTATSVPPKLGVRTLYHAPAPGTDASYQLPKISKKQRNLTGELVFVDDQGNPVAPPDIDAIAAQGPKAQQICFMLLLADNRQDMQANLSEYGSASPRFHTCVDTVARVLARADQIKRQRGTKAAASAAARVCQEFTFSRPRLHPALRVSCAPDGTGLRVDIRPRSPGRTLASALGRHAPKLVVGRSAVTPGPPGLNLAVLWRGH